MTKDNPDLLRLAMEGRKNNLGLCMITKNLSDIDSKLLAQCTQIIPYKKKFIVSTYPLLK